MHFVIFVLSNLITEYLLYSKISLIKGLSLQTQVGKENESQFPLAVLGVAFKRQQQREEGAKGWI